MKKNDVLIDRILIKHFFYLVKKNKNNIKKIEFTNHDNLIRWSMGKMQI